MIVANKGTGRVNLIHGLDRDAGTVKFTPWGTRDSIQALEDYVWGNSRTLQRYLNRGILTKLDNLTEFPDPPEAYQTLEKWQKSRVRKIVLGSNDEFESSALIMPMGNNPGAPRKPDTRYIRGTLVPTLEVSLAWLDSLAKATGDKVYKDRSKRVRDHIASLRELLKDGA